MNKCKKHILLAITFVIVGLMITASASDIIQKQDKNEKTLKIYKNEDNFYNMDIATATKLESQISYNIIKNPQITGIPIFDGITPAISNSRNDLVVGYNSLDQENVYFSGSTDLGETWTDGMGFVLDDPPEKPDVDGCGDGRFLGSMVPGPYYFDGGGFLKVIIGDVSNFEDSFDGMLWTFNDLGDGYTYFIDVDCGGYTATDPDENEWAYGACSIIGDHGSAGIQVPMFTYQCNPDGVAWIYYWSEMEFGTSTSTDIDHDTLRSYSVWNYENETQDEMDIFLDAFEFGVWDEYEGYPIHPGLDSLIIDSVGNDNKIDISARSDNVIIVSERDGDIIAYYGNDVLNSGFSETTIITDAIEPRIDHIGVNNAVCSFVKDGVLNSCTTEDGGATWSNPVQISEEENILSGDVCPLGFVYESEQIIYFGSGGVEQPILEIQSVSGGIGVSAVIKNIGNADATNVQWSINLDGLVFLGKESSGNIASIAPEESKQIKSKFPLGFGNIDIAINAISDEGASAEETASAKLLLFFITGL